MPGAVLGERIEMTGSRKAQLTTTRNRLNAMGEPSHYCADHAQDTLPANGSAWNRKRIRIRNKINARLSATCGAA